MHREVAIGWMLFGLSAIYLALAGEWSLAAIPLVTGMVCATLYNRLQR